ncbi:hypothetical protein TNCT_152771 [Trichonephila clavata]|uniref:Uncharacterized protein n=1 Tax=Trichonephila clavata TaxID=2740835 RepID=A0A8X6H093_TRICU|nr:hypothetical protein TNCT_152771 [Trichonephila clavata]
MLFLGVIENLKAGHQKEGVCVHPKFRRDGEKNHIQIDSDNTLCPENSGAMHAENSLIMHTENSLIMHTENSLIMHTENSISNEGSHSGEK